MKKIRIAVSGIGNRSLPKNVVGSNWQGWVEQIRLSDKFELVAANDVSEEPRRRIIERGYLPKTAVFHGLDEMLDSVKCDALLVSNPAEFHSDTIGNALARDLHVFIEKPFVTSLKDGIRHVLEAERKGLIISVVQNWRAKDSARKMLEAIDSGMLGRVGHIFFRYVRNRENPNYPKYLFREPLPLLYAMGIHHVDLFRHILRDDFSTVSAHSFKPPWSLYESDTGLNMFMKTKGGVAVVYTGTFSSSNSSLPQESMLIEGENGSILNESDWLEPPLYFLKKGERVKIDLVPDVPDASVAGQYNGADKYILDNFHRAVSMGDAPLCSGRDALKSIATIEACRGSCEKGSTITVEEIP